MSAFFIPIYLAFIFLMGCSGVPKKSGYFHQLQKETTLQDLASEFNVTPEELLASNPALRDLDGNSSISQGRLIYIPESKKQGLLDILVVEWPWEEIEGGRSPSSILFKNPLPRISVTSPYGRRGWRHRMHEGVDLRARRGTPIRSAADGKVVFSGVMGGYGRVVVIQHAKGFRTVYAHNSKNLVHKGQRIEAGRLIARAGSSGHATGPHLHFEIRKGKKPLDPMDYLP